MATPSLRIAAEILPHLRANVLAGHVRTYGHYAEAIGRNGAREGVAMGGPMHIIGAACAIARIPIIPVHFVERADGEIRKIFESRPLEARFVAPHWDLISVAARVYRYTEADFQKLHTLVADRFDRLVPYSMQTPQELWGYLITASVEGSTLMERALVRYREIADAERARRQTAT